MIIGLTGTLGAGKGTVADILRERGFRYYSCSDYLRNELARRGEEITIPNLAALGNKLREKHGGGEIAKRVLNMIVSDKALVDSLRHPDEINTLKKAKDFTLIAVDAPLKTRYERIQIRNRHDDNMSFEEFKKQEKLQMNGRGPNMQLGRCIKMAKFKIKNDGSMDDLRHEIDKILGKL